MNITKESREQAQSSQTFTDDETEVVEVYRRAKRMGYADIAITIQEGKRVKLWLTEKKK